MRRLGPERPPTGPTNPVRALTFLGERELISVAADGHVLQWDVAAPQAEARRLFRFERAQNLFRVVVSPEHGNTRWIAAAGQASKPGETASVEVRSLPNGQKVRLLDQGTGHVTQSLAFDANGERLAVGTKHMPNGATFFKETAGSVTIYDLKEEQPRGSPGPKAKLYAEALAFHPDGTHIALADSNNYEVRLFKLSDPNQAVSAIKGKGRSIWEVALSPTGHQVGFLDERNPDPDRPNHRGKGDLRRGDGRVFDLNKRIWEHGKGFQAVEPLETLGGWTVEPDRLDGFVWHVVGPDKQRHTLPLNREQDGIPRCYTFLKNGSQTGVRLAVGHYWGASVFELSPGRPRAASGSWLDIKER